MEDTVQVVSDSNVSIPVQTPKRVLHFSDGVLEEFDEVEASTQESQPYESYVIDTKSLTWVPWFKHYAWAGGNKVVEYCDYVGEGLASFLGITTPKYQLEINEYERRKADEKKMQEEYAGWNTSNEGNGTTTPLVVSQPASNQLSSETIPMQ